MMHFTCDLCQRPLEPGHDVRYVVKLEVYPGCDPLDCDDVDDDRDHLQEVNEFLERLGDSSDADDPADELECQQLTFDLCPECRKRFLKNPLGRKLAEQFDFSQN